MITTEAFQLTIEQQFQLENITRQVSVGRVEDLRDFLIELARQNMIKENLIRHLMKNGI